MLRSTTRQLSTIQVWPRRKLTPSSILLIRNRLVACSQTSKNRFRPTMVAYCKQAAQMMRSTCSSGAAQVLHWTLFIQIPLTLPSKTLLSTGVIGQSGASQITHLNGTTTLETRRINLWLQLPWLELLALMWTHTVCLTFTTVCDKWTPTFKTIPLCLVNSR